MLRLAEALDLLDLAIGRAHGVVPTEAVDRAAATAAAIRTRRDFLGDVLIVALAGGTGSGKPSLLNALAGEPIASVSPLRPHTDRPLAWVPIGRETEIGPLLDALGIEDRAGNDQLRSLVVIDLPDMDSVAEWHRRTVDELLPRVDAVLWVCDPVKYHDRSLHDGYLGPLVPYHRQFVFVLNKVDTLEPDDRGPVAGHLTTLLEEAGYPEPKVVATAAAPGSGGQIGVEELIKHIDHRLEVKLAAIGKLAEDLRAAAATLAEPEHLWEGSATGFSGLGADPEAAIASLEGRVGPTSAARVRAAAGESADPAVATDEVTAILWDRALLAATLAAVGVAALSILAELDARRLP